MEEYHMKVSRIPWEPENYIVDSTDYIFGMVLEIPQMYLIMPNRRIAFVFVIGQGLIRFNHDFSGLDEEQSDNLIYYIRRRFEDLRGQ